MGFQGRVKGCFRAAGLLPGSSCEMLLGCGCPSRPSHPSHLSHSSRLSSTFPRHSLTSTDLADAVHAVAFVVVDAVVPGVYAVVVDAIYAIVLDAVHAVDAVHAFVDVDAAHADIVHVVVVVDAVAAVHVDQKLFMLMLLPSFMLLILVVADAVHAVAFVLLAHLVYVQ